MTKPQCFLTAVERRRSPCVTSDTPELWFSPDMDEGIEPQRIAAIYEDRAIQARLICCTQCPLADQQECAKEALRSETMVGVWAGIKLPGIQWRHHGKREEYRKQLEMVASGAYAVHQLPENVTLLEMAETFYRCPKCDLDKPAYKFLSTSRPVPLPVRVGCKDCRRKPATEVGDGNGSSEERKVS